MGSEVESPAQAVLRHTELVLDCLPRAIIVVDRHGGILAWNRVSEELYGWSRAEVVGRMVQEVVVSPTDGAPAGRIMEVARSGLPWSGDLTVRRRDGGTSRTHSVVGPLRDDSGRVVGAVSAADDVTVRRLLEEQAADLTDHLALALAAGELGTWRWDKATGTVTWDDVLERLFGIEPGTFDGTFETWISLLHPDDVADTLATLDRALATTSPYAVEHRVIWPDGSVHWVQGRGLVTRDEQGAPTGTIGCTGDITARKEMELQAVERVRRAEALAEREHRQRERFEFLTALNDAALAAGDHRSLMRAVATAAVPRLGDWCALHFFPGSGDAPEVEIAHSDPRRIDWARDLQERFPYDPDAPTGVPAVVRSGTTELVPAFDEERVKRIIDTSPSVDPHELRSILDTLRLTSSITVPLITQRGVVGALQLVSAESGRRYDEADVALAEAAAGRVAAALDNTWLSDQQRNIAATLQSALLPPRLPQIPGIGIAVQYWAAGMASEVGGDFYDVFGIDERRWAIVIGDVCGTGPEAAAVTSIARHTIRAAAMHGATHHEVLDWLNDAIRASNRDLFCTALYSTLEPLDDGTWRYTSIAGGHPLPVLVVADGASRTLGEPGTLVGVLPQVAAERSVTRLHPGDTVVLFTDGATDVRPPHHLDAEAFTALVAESATGVTAKEVIERLEARIHAVLPLPERRDDIALVVIRVEGPPLPIS